jgi:DNA-directed RNA polymerase alpha subunit
MAQTTGDEPKNDFPAGIGQPALRALAAAGYTHLEQLISISEAELLKLHGMGPKALGLIRGALHARGLAFADSDKR